MLVLGDLRPLSTLTTSLKGETFSHTYKLTTVPLHNRCGITPTTNITYPNNNQLHLACKLFTNMDQFKELEAEAKVEWLIRA
jgi:hypothetical protein